MKKIGALCIILTILFLLCSCSNRAAKSSEDILSDIIAEDNLYWRDDVEITGFEITSRETNQHDAIDHVWARVNSNGEKYDNARADYELVYHRYDDGWRLADWDRYDLEVDPPEQYRIDNILTEKDITNFQLSNIEQTSGTTYTFHYISPDTSHDNLTIEKLHSLAIKFSSYPTWGWYVDSFDTIDGDLILETDGLEGEWYTSITWGSWALGYTTYDIHINIKEITSTWISYDYTIEKDGESWKTGSVDMEWTTTRYNYGTEREFYLFYADETLFSEYSNPVSDADFQLGFRSNISYTTGEVSSGLLIEYSRRGTYSGEYALEKIGSNNNTTTDKDEIPAQQTETVDEPTTTILNPIGSMPDNTVDLSYWSVPYIEYTEYIKNCTSLIIDLQISDITSGTPYGQWQLYYRDIRGNWIPSEYFDVQGDYTTTEISFDEPISFDALSIIRCSPEPCYHLYAFDFHSFHCYIN